MPAETVDAIVLGAGFVGVSAALALQARGRRVALVDRHGEAAGETSFGNAGIVESIAVVPYVFPRALRDIARGALNLDPRALIRYGALPSIAPAIWRYYAASTPAGKNATATAMAPLLAAANAGHLEFARAAGAEALLRGGGWIKAFRSARGQDMASTQADELKPYGIRPVMLDRAALAALEPHLSDVAIGGVHYTEPLSTPDPEALAQSYAALFVRRGGRFETGDAFSLEAASGGWMVKTASGRLAARDVVIALGPWSDELARSLGLRLPFFVKRGYHMHYEAQGNAGLTRPVLDIERGYLVTPMSRGLRLTTGAEFARRDDPPSSAQLDRVEPFARELFPLGARKEAQPWMGRRPCLPDMRPVIGPFPGKPGLWLDFGHHHLGLTLGPVSGQLLAELISGEAPFVDPAPFRAERFG
ncbi:MAG TPA: FAD-dependent oxidoreductase [Roseiarcus sp.]|jgi:D-amino-acid dehydrogenase